jgi:hypothetical protein
MIFNAYHCALLGVDGMRRRLFLQVEGTFHRHRTMVGSELDLSGGYWFESSRRSKTPGHGAGLAGLHDQVITHHFQRQPSVLPSARSRASAVRRLVRRRPR